MKQNEIVHDDVVLSKIYLIRGMKVMFDFDLAELYEVETKVLNQAVKRNLIRFSRGFHVSVDRDRV
jgi:hypothetical protein